MWLLYILVVPLTLILLLAYLIQKKSPHIVHVTSGQVFTKPTLLSTFQVLSKLVMRTASIKEIFREQALKEPRQPFLLFALPKSSVLVFDLDDAKKVLTSLDYDKDLPTAPEGYAKQLFGGSLLMAGGDHGRKHRKLLDPAFSYGKIAKLFPKFIETTKHLVVLLKSQNLSKPLMISQWMKNFTLDTLGQAGFGFKFDAMEGGTTHKYDLDETFLAAIDPIDFVTKGIYSKIAPFESVKRRNKCVSNTRQLILNVINKRLEERNKTSSPSDLERDLLDLILASNSSEDTFSLSAKEILSDILLFFLAGHETSASALTSVFYFLGKHPEIQERVHAEISQQIGENEITPENIKSLKYCECVLKETLRIHPPTPMLGSRVSVKDTELSGYKIPKGTNIFCTLVRAHFDENVWPKPFEFNPTRFLGENNENRANLFVPFSYGPRVCIGQRFAMTEMTIGLVMLARAFSWKLQDGFVWKDDPASPSTLPLGGLPIFLTKRD